jgi:hypothetical protein
MTDQQILRLTAICSSDRMMDILDTHKMLDTPVNTYEVSCTTCSFPNIDKTPNPYFIAKGRALSGIEVMEADMGNLFVSDRVKRILEILCSDQCAYEKTFIYQTGIPTKWWLAIPNTLVINGEVKDNIKRCKVCNQPLHAHPGTQYKFWLHELEAPADIAKASNWHSTDENDWKNWWIGRDVFLSLRLISLLKKISAKGFEKLSLEERKYKSLTTAEKKWVEQSIVKIGSLKDNIKFEVTSDKLDKFKHHFSVTEMPDAIKVFEKRFKIDSNEITKIICSIKGGTQIDIGFDSPFLIEDVQNWQSTKTKTKLVAFAFDDFGNYLLFSPTDKNCPLYFYDHETMLYDLIQLSILNLTTA